VVKDRCFLLFFYQGLINRLCYCYVNNGQHLVFSRMAGVIRDDGICGRGFPKRVTLCILTSFNVVMDCLKINIHSRNNQHNSQICTTTLFYMLAPTCFGKSLPSSGSLTNIIW
jgi:hypothetical protein